MGKNVLKGIFGATICAITLFGFTLNVHAEEKTVSDENSLRSCVQGNNTCVLQNDITLSDKKSVTIAANANVIINLNGKTITENNLGITAGLIELGSGSTLTINDTTGNGGIKATTSYAAITVGADSTLTVNNGNYTGYWYAISGNGTRHNTNITINNGTFKVIASSEAPGIYHPQNGTLTINGGYIEGTEGIEIRAGKLVVNGGTIVGTGSPTTVTPNGSGTTTEGAGIAIAQHTTKLPINVEINGGTVKGYTALYESNPQKNDASAIAQVKIAVNDGNFEAINGGTQAVYSEDVKGFINGGTFNTDVTDYVADGVETSENNGVFTVRKDIPEVNVPAEENVSDKSETVNIENPKTADNLPLYLMGILASALVSGLCIRKLA